MIRAPAWAAGMRAAWLVAIAACSRRAPLASCDDDLRGVYASELPGAHVPLGSASELPGEHVPAGTERWMVLDDGATLTAYPLFADTGGAQPAGLEVAPRRIELARTPGHAMAAADRDSSPAPLAGTVHRSYLQRAARCDGRAPAHVTRCTGDALELVLGEPAPPLGFAPCTWPGPTPSRVARWHRE